MTKTRLIVGPEPELAPALSSQRFFFGLMKDPLVHYYRVTFMNQQRTTQPVTLCGRKVALGRFYIRANTMACAVCTLKARWQSRLPLL